MRGGYLGWGRGTRWRNELGVWWECACISLCAGGGEGSDYCVRGSVLLASMITAIACIPIWTCTGDSDRTPFAS
jgi:hypothetical protein